MGTIGFFTASKRSCGKVMFLHLSDSHSVHRGEGFCMMSLPVWLPGPTFLPGVYDSVFMFLLGGVSVHRAPLDRDNTWTEPPGHNANEFELWQLEIYEISAFLKATRKTSCFGFVFLHDSCIIGEHASYCNLRSKLRSEISKHCRHPGAN